jgi:hypothetical protein
VWIEFIFWWNTKQIWWFDKRNKDDLLIDDIYCKNWTGIKLEKNFVFVNGYWFRRIATDPTTVTKKHHTPPYPPQPDCNQFLAVVVAMEGDPVAATPAIFFSFFSPAKTL